MIKLNSYSNNNFGISDEYFFLLVLENVPEGTKITFDSSEPKSWVEALKPWSYRNDKKQYEADYYIIGKDFIKVVKELIKVELKSFQQIHHLTIYGDNIQYFKSFDNFDFIHFEKAFEKIINEKIKNIFKK